jgi:hypothetical protein
LFHPALKLDAFFSHGIGQGFDPTMIGIDAAIKNDFPHVFAFKSFGQKLTEDYASGFVLRVLALFLEFLLERRRGRDDRVIQVVDNLCVDEGIALENVNAGPGGCSPGLIGNPVPQPFFPDLFDFHAFFKHRSLLPFFPS